MAAMLLARGTGAQDEAVASVTPARGDVRLLYNDSCASCHGKDGRAKTFRAAFNKARNLTEAQWQEATSDEQLFESIKNGRAEMPAFGKEFDDEQIRQLLLYVRQFKNG